MVSYVVMAITWTQTQTSVNVSAYFFLFTITMITCIYNCFSVELFVHHTKICRNKTFFYRHMYVVIISNKVFFLTFSKFKLLFWQLRHKGNNPWHFLSIKKIKMEVPFFVEIVFQKFPNKWAHYVSKWLSRYHDEAQ